MIFSPSLSIKKLNRSQGKALKNQNQKEIQQAANDEKWVPKADRVKISPTNMRIDPSMTLREETYQVILDVIKNYSFFKAFLASVVVPKIYVKQFWHTFTKSSRKEFIVPPSEDELLTFLVGLGYKGLLNQLPQMLIDHMHQPWRTLASIINKCLSGKIISNDRLRQSRVAIIWDMFHKKIGEDIQEYGRAIPDAMLTNDINQSETYQMFIKYSTGLIHLKKTRARQVHATHERTVTESDPEPARKRPSEQLAADTMQALKASRKPSRSQLLTRGLSKGTGVSPRGPNESTVILTTSSKQTGTKPGGDEQVNDDEDEDMNNAKDTDTGNDDEEITDTAKADAEKTKEVKGDNKKAELPPSSSSLSVSLDPLAAISQRKKDVPELKVIDHTTTLLALLRSKISSVQVDYKDMIEESMQANIINKVKNLLPKFLPKRIQRKFSEKRDDDEDLSARPNQGKKTKRSRTKESEPSKKASTTKESAKDKSPAKMSKFGKSVTVEEPVKELVFKMASDDIEQTVDDVVNNSDQPSEDTTQTNDKAPKTVTESDPEPARKRPSEGDRCPFVLTKPLPLKGHPSHLTIAAEYFFNNDLDFLKSLDPEKKYTTSITKTKEASVKVKKLHGYGHLEEIVVRRADQQLYKPKEGDFIDVHLNDIEDMLLLAVQHKLFQLDGSDIVGFIVALYGTSWSIEVDTCEPVGSTGLQATTIGTRETTLGRGVKNSSNIGWNKIS
nr:hypothetical protein [Tanacetum cinerariifolium]